MAVLDFQKSVWQAALGELPHGVPDVLILEGTWWREKACKERLACLTEVSELPFPDMFVGRFGGARVAYCCAYGAARAVEPAHVFAQLGTPLAIQIGTCGVLTADIEAGSVVVPRHAQAGDGISGYYGAGEEVAFDEVWAARAEALLKAQGVSARPSEHLTWPSLFAQSDEMCRRWTKEGLETIDMEASAVAAVMAHFGQSSLTLLAAWDQLDAGKTFLDPLPAAQQEALTKANTATFETALQIAVEVSQHRQS